MAKRVKEAALGTRTARLRLPARHKPFFRALGEGLHIGYRRSTVAGKAGSWLLRRYIVERHGAERVVDDLAPFWAILLDAPAEDAAVAVRELASKALAEEQGSADQEAPRVGEAALEPCPASRSSLTP
jgi:hypothetical protein